VLKVRAVLYNVSPDLIALWSFNLSILAGVLVLLVAALVTGLVAAGFFLLPVRVRGAVSMAVLVVLALGLFRDLIITVILHWGFVQYIFAWFTGVRVLIRRL
jgi:hypothetical protein